MPVVLEKGDYVFFKPPLDWQQFGIERYMSRDLSGRGVRDVLKYVAAVEGDTVQITSDGITVNGVLLPLAVPLQFDLLGRPIPPFKQSEIRLASGEFLVCSDNQERVLDSRYFGILNNRHLVGRAVKSQVIFHMIWN